MDDEYIGEIVAVAYLENDAGAARSPEMGYHTEFTWNAPRDSAIEWLQSRPEGNLFRIVEVESLVKAL